MRREILTHVTAFTCVPSLLVVQLPRAGGFILLVIKAPPSTLPARMLSHLTYVSGVWDQRSEWKITAGQIDGCGYVRQQGHTSQPRRPAAACRGAPRAPCCLLGSRAHRARLQGARPIYWVVSSLFW